MEPWPIFEQYRSELASTALFLLALLLARSFLVRRVQDLKLSADTKRRWFLQIRNGTLTFLLMGLIIIWGEELRGLALSVVAVGAALVIAVKELILCLSGSVVRGSAPSFRLGDRIEIAQVRGEVIDHNLLTTTLLEIGPGQTSQQRTGRRITLPNSLFLNHPVINETCSHEYVLHVFSLPVPLSRWREAEKLLLQAAEEECSSYLDEARQHMESLERREGVEASNVQPRVSLQWIEPEKLHLVMRIPVPAEQRGRVEQAVLRRLAESELSVKSEPPAAPSAASEPV
ncbi:MAG: mechanosensitive ion channel family protein [Armatimonadetes bacterium]|nr:mechanosensitive ion channel family protein [Armatimonadota bacterium]